MRDQVLRLFKRAGAKATPETIGTVIDWLRRKIAEGNDAPEIAELLQAAERLHAEYSAIEVPQPATPSSPTPTAASFMQALAQSLSNAAAGSLHDKLLAKHRPSGRVAPRPRWAEDEPPLGGWYDGTERIKQRPEPKLAEGKYADLAAELKLLGFEPQQQPKTKAHPTTKGGAKKKRRIVRY